MLGGSSGFTVHCHYFGLGSESKAIDFLNRLAAGEGSGAPLGDKLALAIRLTKVVREVGGSQQLIDSMRAWLATLGDELSEFSSLRSIVAMLHNEVWVKPAS